MEVRMSILQHHLDPPRSRAPRRRAGRATAWLAAGTLSLFVAGCGDVESPVAPLAPTVAMPTLVGSTSVDLLAGQPSGTRADARGLNDAGQVTGSRYLILVNDWRPYRWSPGTGFQALSGICCGTAWGTDINDAGVVVGRAQTAVDEGDRAFVAVATTMVNLGLLPGVDPEGSSDAVAVNDANQIVGWSNTTLTARHAVLWSPAFVIQDLGVLGGLSSEAVDINGAGQVIGMSDVAGGGRQAFIWTAGTGMQSLDAIIGYPVVPVAINAAGQIAGSYSAPNGESHAFLYTPGSGVTDLGTLGGDASVATGLNDLGQVVGNSKTASGAWHAFLWTPEEGMEDVTAVTGFTSVRKLNDHLQTLTGGIFPQSEHPYIVTLVVQPAWPFTGFGNPIDESPEWNAFNGGREVMLRFGLGGDRGLAIFAAGSPAWVQLSCATGAPIGAATPVSPGDLELRYQKGPDRYTLRVATSDAWSGTCRQLDLKLADGSTHSLRFSFR
jgi:probable HAF family extracellular repeat protein